MVMKYITKIRANISIYTKKKTSNILDGTYNSIYKGRSLNFEDLREYVVGDNVKDIDWKASARSNKILIRRFEAEKKHNILFIMDSGKKMEADTKSFEPKKNVALMSMGTIAYIAAKNGDSISAIYSDKDRIKLTPFRTGTYNIERILNDYERVNGYDSKYSLSNLVNYVIRFIRRRMLIFIVTDIEGMDKISEDLLKKLSYLHDVMFINVSDSMMTGYNAYDVDVDDYIPDIILKDPKLNEIEEQLKKEIYTRCKKKFKKYKITTSTINSETEVVEEVVKLLERHKNAVNS